MTGIRSRAGSAAPDIRSAHRRRIISCSRCATTLYERDNSCSEHIDPQKSRPQQPRGGGGFGIKTGPKWSLLRHSWSPPHPEREFRNWRGSAVGVASLLWPPLSSLTCKRSKASGREEVKNHSPGLLIPTDAAATWPGLEASPW